MTLSDLAHPGRSEFGVEVESKEEILLVLSRIPSVSKGMPVPNYQLVHHA
jgi:hypothetical protein